MAEAPLMNLAAPPPLMEAAPRGMPSRMAMMRDMAGSKPSLTAAEIGEGILQMIQAMPQHRARLTEALRAIVEVTQAQLEETAQSEEAQAPGGPPGDPSGLTGMPPGILSTGGNATPSMNPAMLG